MSMKEKYHTFESDNRKADVFAVWPNKWLVEAYEDNTLAHSKEVANDFLFFETPSVSIISNI